MFLYLTQDQMLKFRHLRGNFFSSRQNSHLRYSCTRPFNYAIQFQTGSKYQKCHGDKIALKSQMVYNLCNIEVASQSVIKIALSFIEKSAVQMGFTYKCFLC